MIVTLLDYQPESRFDALPWTDVRIEEAAYATGPWTPLETITLDPVDADPSVPAARSFTTSLATLTSGWYRLVWVDAALQESATSPVRNTLPFATSDDLAARLGLTFSDDEAARATNLLTLATAIIQDETGQTITLVADDVLTRPSVAGERVRLPQRPVVSVASVAIDGTEIPAGGGSWYLEGDELVRANWRLLTERHFWAYNGVGWLGPLRTLSVVYTHGYAVIPAVVKTVCLEMAARCFTNPGAVIQESIAGVTTTYSSYSSGAPGLRMTEAEKKDVNDVVRRTAGSLTLR